MRTFVILTSAAMFGFIFQAGASNSQLAGAATDNFPSNTSIAAITTASEANKLFVSFLEVASEESLALESWMTNENLFVPMALTESEEPMEIEEWMMNADNFKETTFTEESDQALEIESWMVDTENFSTSTIGQETEPVLEVQEWMLNASLWGR